MGDYFSSLLEAAQVRIAELETALSSAEAVGGKAQHSLEHVIAELDRVQAERDQLAHEREELANRSDFAARRAEEAESRAQAAERGALDAHAARDSLQAAFARLEQDLERTRTDHVSELEHLKAEAAARLVERLEGASAIHRAELDGREGQLVALQDLTRERAAERDRLAGERDRLLHELTELRALLPLPARPSPPSPDARSDPIVAPPFQRTTDLPPQRRRRDRLSAGLSEETELLRDQRRGES